MSGICWSLRHCHLHALPDAACLHNSPDMLCSCRLLGVEHAATFEEVQDARNYLYEVSKHMRQKCHNQAYVHILWFCCQIATHYHAATSHHEHCHASCMAYCMKHICGPLQEFKAHGRSREAIEMAFDAILKQKMKVRHKYGFKPPKSGRRSDVEGDPTVSLHSWSYSDAHTNYACCRFSCGPCKLHAHCVASLACTMLWRRTTLLLIRLLQQAPVSVHHMYIQQSKLAQWHCST